MSNDGALSKKSNDTKAERFLIWFIPLYHDGYSISLMAISDDWGQTWHTSAPLVGAGNIQPSLVQRRDGSLHTVMRDNGPAPHRLQQSDSSDQGETWSPVTDTDLPNPGSGAEIISLRNGHWVLISNDTESGRYQLAVQISEDEGCPPEKPRQACNAMTCAQLAGEGGQQL